MSEAPRRKRPALPGAITDTFALGLWLVGAALLVVFLIPQVPMRDTGAMMAARGAQPAAEPAE